KRRERWARRRAAPPPLAPLPRRLAARPPPAARARRRRGPRPAPPRRRAGSRPPSAPQARSPDSAAAASLTILLGMSPYRLAAEADGLDRPVVLAAFDGWIDAAGASTAAVGQVATDAATVVEFDPDSLFDFRSRRPVLDIVDGTLTGLGWPELRMKRARHADRDVLVFSGAEPDYRWQELGRDTVEIVRRLGVQEWISLGSIPA